MSDTRFGKKIVRWWVVRPGGPRNHDVKVDGPYYFQEAALMMLASHPGCVVKREVTYYGD